jgi:S-adenosylmethionine:tRNA ribosyltransferase-isomerase
MVVERATGGITHRHFRDLPSLVAPRDLIVVNTTRVIRARLLGHRDSGAPAEIFLLRPIDEYRFEAMVSPGGKLHPGRVVHIAPELDVEIEAMTERRTRIVRLITKLSAPAALERYGATPLPPYIQRTADATDAERYQTVYARQEGSVAAPTAGLHFTAGVLERLRKRGVEIAEVTLDVGLGTFEPVRTEEIEEHKIHKETYEISDNTAAAIARVKRAGRPVLAVGTTVARTLEDAAQKKVERGVVDGAPVSAGRADAEIFILPGKRFRVIDQLLTNFHLPQSTLLAMVCAFAGRENVLAAYRHAVESGYRFYSYGDCMLIR